MTSRHLSIALAALLGLQRIASAQTAPAPATPSGPVVPTPPTAPSGDKVDAKSLMQSGVSLLQVKDYLGALAVFKDAYRRFPSAKILLNIGTTLSLLGRNADAANAYQRFLDSKDTDPARHDQVVSAIADLDKTVGRVRVTITPADSEVQVGDDEWMPAAAAVLWRVAPGPTKIRGRHAGYIAGDTTVTTAVGSDTPATLTLELVPAPVATGMHPFGDDNDLHQEVEAGPRSRLGALVLAHVDVVHSGAAGFVGLTFDATERLEVQAAAVLGPNFGGYAGGAFALLTGDIRPVVSAGMPIFFDGGARFSVRGALGLEYEANKHLSIILEVGVEHVLNPNDAFTDSAGVMHTFSSTSFIPAVGAAARL